MLGLKQKRRMVRNPFVPNQPYYPYQNFQQNQLPNYQQMFPLQGFHTNQPFYNNPNQNYMYQQNQIPFQMPYPNQQINTTQGQPKGFQSILNQFKTKEGGYDVNKMMDTAGQMINTMSQINGVFKQVGGFFKPKS